MTIGMNSLLALALCASLGAACKKKAPDGAAAPAPAPDAVVAPVAPVVIDAAPPTIDAAATAPVLPAELQTFDATVTPLLAIADDDARTKAACKALPSIKQQIAAVGKHPPAGVDAAAWATIAERSGSGLQDFEIECGEGSATSTTALAEAAAMTAELTALLKAN